MNVGINSNIDPAYWWLTALTLPLWCRAIVWNVRAAHIGVVEGVKIRAATAVLAAIYLTGNLVLLFTDVAPANWSDVMRGFQLLSIPLVWEAPARLSVRMGEKIRETDRKVVDRYDGEF